MLTSDLNEVPETIFHSSTCVLYMLRHVHGTEYVCTQRASAPRACSSMSVAKHCCSPKHRHLLYGGIAARSSSVQRPVHAHGCFLSCGLSCTHKRGAASTVTQCTVGEHMTSLGDYDAVVANAPGPDEAQWVFGYGSIVFRPGFTPGEKVSGCIRGWKRVMYQHSTGNLSTNPLSTAIQPRACCAWCPPCCLPVMFPYMQRQLQPRPL